MSKQLVGNLYSSAPVTFPVTSVNAKQGEVILSPGDIGAATAADLDNVFGIATAAIPGTDGIKRVQKITAAAYAALATKVADTLYVVVG